LRHGTALRVLQAASLTLDFAPAALSADSVESRRDRPCGLCLLDVDWPPPSCADAAVSSSSSSSSSLLPKLSYGGRQYHAACANFWLNFVDLTLPSLTVPELL